MLFSQFYLAYCKNGVQDFGAEQYLGNRNLHRLIRGSELCSILKLRCVDELSRDYLLNSMEIARHPVIVDFVAQFLESGSKKCRCLAPSLDEVQFITWIKDCSTVERAFMLIIDGDYCGTVETLSQDLELFDDNSVCGTLLHCVPNGCFWKWKRVLCFESHFKQFPAFQILSVCPYRKQFIHTFVFRKMLSLF